MTGAPASGVETLPDMAGVPRYDLFALKPGVNGLPLPQNTSSRRRGRLAALCRPLTSRRLVYITLAVVVIYTWEVLSSGIPSTYQDIRRFEESLPQHNRTKAVEAGTRYLRISRPVTGRGFNNVLQEALLHSYLALTVNRAFVFEDYTWSHSPLPYTLYDTSLRPSRIPFNAFISGPTAGGEMSFPRAVNVDFWNKICPPSKRKVISSIKQPANVDGKTLLEWWTEKLQGLDDRCVEIDSEKRTIFDYILFGETRIQSLWPGLSKSPIYTAFKWSALVESTLEKNLAAIHPAAVQSSSLDDATTLRGLVAVHLRRGDFKGHCKYLIRWKAEYMGFNRFPEMDMFDASKISQPDELKEYYMRHCMPEVDQIVERLHAVRKVNPGINRVYAMTNGKESWMNELKRALLSDGWLDVTSSLDLRLDSAQQHVSMAVDMAIAEKADVFVGNGPPGHQNNDTTSTIASDDKRWSEVVPPNAALTFAVVWDPEDGIVAFSGANLLNSHDAEGVLLDSPTDVYRSSQLLPVEKHALSSAENRTTLAFFSEHRDLLFKRRYSVGRLKIGKTRVSSTLDGLDVYLRGSMFAKAHLQDRQISWIGELDKDFDFDPMTSFANKWRHAKVTDDGLYINAGRYTKTESVVLNPGLEHGVIDDEEFNLSSAFSVTTTSTSNYVDVEFDDDDESASWSTLEVPNTPSFWQLLVDEQQRRSTGRLKKRKPMDVESPASPSDVLQRPQYNHREVQLSDPPRSPKRKAIPGFIRSISMGRLRSPSEKELPVS
ncbi:hypothetical protein DXG01_002346 [Tephrocybe rancida]|nr:hypothetical protein DXG01_002346 [Tephrocybe rancida]